MRRMLQRIKQMVVKEFIQIFRDRKMKPIIFVTPVLQLIVFGYAVTMDVTNIRMAVYDLDKTSVTREIARRSRIGIFQIINFPDRCELGTFSMRGQTVCSILTAASLRLEGGRFLSTHAGRTRTSPCRGGYDTALSRIQWTSR